MTSDMDVDKVGLGLLWILLKDIFRPSDQPQWATWDNEMKKAILK